MGLQCVAIEMRASKQVVVLFLDGTAVQTAMVFQRIVATNFMTGRQPAADTFQQLLVLECRLFLERVEQHLPGNLLLGCLSPLEFLVGAFPESVQHGGFTLQWVE